MTELLRPPLPLGFESWRLGPAWKAWKKRFMVYLTASDNDDVSKKKKRLLLLHTIRDSLVRDRFICELSAAAVKEKLLGMMNITLEKAIDKCKACRP